MKIEEERKVFINTLKKFDYFNYATKRWDNANNRFEHDGVQTHWEMWVASANREGYKLVPEKPNNKQVEKAVYDLNLSGNTDILVDIYKAMIGGCDD